MTSSSRSPDGWAQHEDDPDPDHQIPPGPLSITSMPVAKPIPDIRPPSKLGRTVAGPTPEQSDD